MRSPFGDTDEGQLRSLFGDEGGGGMRSPFGDTDGLGFPRWGGSLEGQLRMISSISYWYCIS